MQRWSGQILVSSYIICVLPVFHVYSFFSKLIFLTEDNTSVYLFLQIFKESLKVSISISNICFVF